MNNVEKFVNLVNAEQNIEAKQMLEKILKEKVAAKLKKDLSDNSDQK